MKVIVIGSTGLLGGTLCPHLKNSGVEAFTAGRKKECDHIIDMLSVDSYLELFKLIKPDFIINLVGATDVDRCENDFAYAFEANAAVPLAISRAVLTEGNDRIRILHISTDQVYSGDGPHKENEVHPVNVYGLTKCAGEQVYPRSRTTILRSNFFGPSHVKGRSSFSDWVVNSLVSNKEINLFQDVIFSALSMSTLSEIIYNLLNGRNHGTFNVGCRDSMSKASFALALASELGLQTKTGRVTNMKEFETLAPRPLDMSMSIGRFEAATGLVCPSFRHEIELIAEEYKNV